MPGMLSAAQKSVSVRRSWRGETCASLVVHASAGEVTKSRLHEAGREL